MASDIFDLPFPSLGPTWRRDERVALRCKNAGHPLPRPVNQASMPPTPDTRKPAQSLTTADLDAFPIWQFADDEEGIEGRDETWVRPVDARSVPRRSYTIVAADFRAACGREFRGHIAVSRLEDPAEI